MKTGLALEGGAMRGMFTCGVLDVFMENGLRFDSAAGISAGAVFGCNLKSRQPGRALRYNKRFCRDPRYASLRSLLRTGDLYNADFCYRTIPDELDPFDRQACRENPMEFFVGATDVDTGEIAYRDCRTGDETDMQWLRASASMPLVSRLVEVDGRRMLDGGIVDPIPLRVLEEHGCGRIVVILTQPLTYRKEPNRLLPLMRFMMRKTPKIPEAVAVRHEMYNAVTAGIRRREEAGELLVIRPPEPLRIGAVERDPAQLERVYQLGRREAERRLGEVRAWIGATT